MWKKNRYTALSFSNPLISSSSSLLVLSLLLTRQSSGVLCFENMEPLPCLFCAHTSLTCLSTMLLMIYMGDCSWPVGIRAGFPGISRLNSWLWPGCDVLACSLPLDRLLLLCCSSTSVCCQSELSVGRSEQSKLTSDTVPFFPPRTILLCIHAVMLPEHTYKLK